MAATRDLEYRRGLLFPEAATAAARPAAAATAAAAGRPVSEDGSIRWTTGAEDVINSEQKLAVEVRRPSN